MLKQQASSCDQLKTKKENPTKAEPNLGTDRALSASAVNDSESLTTEFIRKKDLGSDGFSRAEKSVDL